MREHVRRTVRRRRGRGAGPSAPAAAGEMRPSSDGEERLDERRRAPPASRPAIGARGGTVGSRGPRPADRRAAVARGTPASSSARSRPAGRAPKRRTIDGELTPRDSVLDVDPAELAGDRRMFLGDVGCAPRLDAVGGGRCAVSSSTVGTMRREPPKRRVRRALEGEDVGAEDRRRPRGPGPQRVDERLGRGVASW